MSGLPNRHAIVIGVDHYGRGITPLRTAAADARAVAQALERDHGYSDTQILIDHDATSERIEDELESLLGRVTEQSALVLYFAGHGVALGDGSEGPRGYLLPQDATREVETWVSMADLRETLAGFSCRHMLVALDCCFAGSFRWSSTRNIAAIGRPLYDSQFKRFVQGKAWQVLTSASHLEEAADVSPGRENTRDGDVESGHSPFAAALLEALSGAADSSRGHFEPDGVITATELYQYIFEILVPPGAGSRQTPGLWPLRPDNTGEFVFLSPQRDRNTRPDPPLDDTNNPWLGLKAYDHGEAELFFGRERVVQDLLKRTLDDHGSPLLAVVGASGTGKSSVVKAGLVPRLVSPTEEQEEATGAWRIVSMPRLEGDPGRQLRSVEQKLAEIPADYRKLLFIDQFEELYTQCPDTAKRESFLERLRRLMAAGENLKVVLTLRSDFEPRLAASEALGSQLARARYLVPVLSSAELREIVEEPARRKALYFEPAELVDEVVDEVMTMPGALPLLSFALSEMYRQAQLRRRGSGELDRGILRQDYESAGGVVGSLQKRATTLYEAADAAHRQTIRRLFLRMLSQEGGRLARRRVEEKELIFADAKEQERLEKVVDQYVQARLLVRDEGHLEPAHDTLILAWEKLLDWLQEAGPQDLMRQTWRAAVEWDETRVANGRRLAAGLLWNEDPRLPQAREMRPRLNRLEQDFVDASLRRKTLKRYIMVATTAVVVAVLAAIAVFALHKAEESESQKVLAQLAQAKAELNQSVTFFEQDRVPEAMSLVGSALRTDPGSVPARGLALEALSRRRWQVPVAVLPHDATVNDLQISPDDTIIAVAYEDGSVTLWGGVTGAEPLELPALDAGTTRLAFSPDGKFLASGSRDGEVRLFDLPAGSAPYRSIQKDGADISSLEFDAEGRRILVSSFSGYARIWDVRTGERLTEVSHGKKRVQRAHFSTDGSHIVTASSDNSVRIWDAETGAPVGRASHSKTVLWADFSADGRSVYSISFDWYLRQSGLDGRRLNSARQPILPGGATLNRDRTRLLVISGHAQVYDSSLDPLGQRMDHGTAVLDATFGPQSLVLTAAQDGAARIFDWRSGERYEAMIHESPPQVVAYSHSGDWVATGTSTGETAVWRISGREHPQPPRLRSRGGRVLSVEFSPDGNQLAVASEKGVRLFPTATGAEIEDLDMESPISKVEVPYVGRPQLNAHFDPEGRYLLASTLGRKAYLFPTDPEAGQRLVFEHDDAVRVARPSADGERILTASEDGVTRIWDANTGNPLSEVMLPGVKVLDAVWSHDGKWLATATSDNVARVWHAATGEPRLWPDGEQVRIEHGDPIVRIAISADDRWLASAGGSAKLLDLDSGDPVNILPALPGVDWVLFRPDNRALLTVSGKAAQSWSLLSMRRIGADLVHPETLAVHKAWSNAILVAQYSPDGQLILTAGRDGQARIWVAESGFLLSERMTHQDEIWSATFSHDGRRIATATRRGEVSIWATPFGAAEDAEMLAQAVEVIGGRRMEEAGYVLDLGERVANAKELCESTSCDGVEANSATCIVHGVFCENP